MTDSAKGDWFHPRGQLARDGWETIVDASITGWSYTGIRVAELGSGEDIRLGPDPVERIVVPLSGSFSVVYRTSDSDADRRQLLAGRASVFHGPTDVIYLSTGTTLTITSLGTGTGRVAVAEAPTTVRHPVAYIPVADVPVELRGAGRSSRQVHNFGTPQALLADRLIVCEVITPAENWSSYPPHKHDEDLPGEESRLEEIYYFETAVTRGASPHPKAAPFGLMQNYSSVAGEIETLESVRSGDIALVPFGWHGPCIAPPGYDLYYLNVMAGPDPDRVWNITDDPAHAWIRDTWTGQDIDARLPYTPSERTPS